MSADLLAAFGNKTSTSKAPDNVDHEKITDRVIPRPDPWQIDQQVAESGHEDRPLWERDSKGHDILFDASESDKDDEFGDFEAVEDVSSRKSRIAEPEIVGVNLLDLSDDSPQDDRSSGAGQATTSATHHERDLFDGSRLAPEHQQPKQDISTIVVGHEDEWGDFEEVPQATVSRQNYTPTKTIEIHSEGQPVSDEEEWHTFEDGPAVQPESTSEVIMNPSSNTTRIQHTPKSHTVVRERPTNIPPPFALLHLLTVAVQKVASNIKSELVGAGLSSVADRIVSLNRTSSRVIAGRSQRWKRDSILSQSMRISQVSQKNTGMKLTALDRSETIKEDQEAIEVASAWTNCNHILNPVLLKAKVQRPAMNINANMKIRSVSGPGVLTDREPCAICGIRRNERVVGIDMKADDIFDEFWIGHWGHTDCQKFWFEYKDLLDHR